MQSVLIKLYVVKNKNKKLINIKLVLYLDDAIKIFIESQSDDEQEDYTGSGISYKKETAITDAIEAYNKVASKEFQISRSNIRI